ncbi:DivIVA domain-containing protein [Blastococcus sp. MG754426]|uniref:DivIVA domain-containing protein n=1 Tax=unclassified Blastococcus TaxID=2619396 RepID=UPI001EF0FD0A|nr:MULTISPECIES: DivIVA domain-containing protein [unclassified Blastococcus]MCF6507445.1 DivIVA domain-containing protein [Blastococcus sp. MG754426]MCF6512007.1 DivIVA domain-containing protein [Blastococcus sp. MG754427]MCF6734952.1 DivIVA domain-containing protein [Blastococcus sp. KM273129]
MTTTETSGNGGAARRLTPEQIRGARFTSGSMLHPGYDQAEVDRFRDMVAAEVGSLVGERDELRHRVTELEQRLSGATVPEPPSEQAVKILASAQQTADEYVAEAEDFSRQMTAEARDQYEEQLRLARENAGAIMQAAQEAAARLSVPTGGDGDAAGQRTAAELEEQVAFLKAFAQACRAQLRAYLEALLTDVETEWGRVDPALAPEALAADRTGRRPGGPAAPQTAFHGNSAAGPAEEPADDADRTEPAGARATGG